LSSTLFPAQLAEAFVDYSKVVTSDPGIRGGKPCIRGMRITVKDVLDYLSAGMTQEQILSDFPDLTADDIQACLGYAKDSRTQI